MYLIVGDEQVKLDLIHFRYYETAEDLINSFDFTICQLVTDGDDLITDEFSLWDIGRNKLAIHNVTYGVSTIRRLIKYTKQGFTACSGTFADILERCIKDPSVVNKETEYID